MNITLSKRESGKGVNLLRREGYILAVVYDKTGKSVPVKLEKKIFETHLRNIDAGGLATVRFTLTLDNETFIAYVKDISYHKTTYAIQHIDFMRVEETDQITLYIPVILKGAEACAGLVQGGQLKKVKRSVKTTCLVSEIPKNFIIDVTSSKLGDQVRVSDVVLSPSMKLRIHEKQVLVSVTKK